MLVTGRSLLRSIVDSVRLRIWRQRASITEAQHGRARWARCDSSTSRAGCEAEGPAVDASWRIAKKCRKRRESLKRDGSWTYFCRPTVSANSSRSDLRWPRRKLFDELDMMSVPLVGLFVLWSRGRCDEVAMLVSCVR